MKLLFGAALGVILAGCATQSTKPVATQVVTFPDGALIEFNGVAAGRAPSKVVLPQDEYGRLNGNAVIRAIPNSEQHALFEQRRAFDPSRKDRVPDQIMIDMTLRDTNVITSETTVAALQSAPDSKKPGAVPRVERSKPTQAVGLDRWNPGKY